ncbi:MAG: NUDIX domain-containing protein [Clostridia bacterium]|nr:NUDIX domain-containing protein [Clostridia bacterium]
MSYISEMRKYVGHAPIMAVAAMGILYSEEKGLLLEKRTDTGEWCTPGGAIELGESLEEALRREIKEETNLDFNNPKLFDIKANVHMVYPNKDEVYYTDVVYEINEFYGELKPDAESKELAFFSLDNLPQNIMPTQIGYIEKYVKMKKSDKAFL